MGFVASRSKKIPEHSNRNTLDDKMEKEDTRPELFHQSTTVPNRTRAKPRLSIVTNGRDQAFSAPGSLNSTGRDSIPAAKFDEHDPCVSKFGALGQCVSSPLPLPLPSPQGSVLKNAESFKVITARSPISTAGPLPLPLPGGAALRKISQEEASSARSHFSASPNISEGCSPLVFSPMIGDNSQKVETKVTHLLPPMQGTKDLASYANMLASLRHPQLCRFLGFHEPEGSDRRMLVYERLHHGSLDRLLYGRSDGPSVDWFTRMKVALCAAKGLAYLHEEGPFQAMYSELSTSNIQIDKDFSAKLSGYGCLGGSELEKETPNASPANASLSVETSEGGLLTPKSNVWSFGVVLLELLTGRKNFDPRHPKEERNIVKWSKPFLSDDSRLAMIVDPRIKQRCPPKAARAVADIALKCLRNDPSERPTMRAIVESLGSVQDVKHPCRFPLQDPLAIARKEVPNSPSFGAAAYTRMSSPSPSAKVQPLPLPPAPSALLRSLPSEDGKHLQQSSSASIQ